MIASIKCQRCNQEIELELERFGGKKNLFGQTVNCPHCNQSTLLNLNLASTATKKTAKTSLWTIIIGGIIILSFVIYFAVQMMESKTVAKEFFPTAGGFFLLGVLTIFFIVGATFIFFLPSIIGGKKK